jgi:homoprotocatechuate degradation regulator HpaR
MPARKSNKQSAQAQRAAAMSKNIPLRDLSRSLPLALMRARESVMQYFRPHHRRYQVTEQQWRVLRVLFKSGELEATELARQSLLLAPSLTRILRDLEASRMITRRWDEADRRRSMIAIAPAGVELLAKVAPLSEASFAEITRLYGETRLNQLFKLLGELEAALKRPEAEESDEGEERAAAPPPKRRARKKSKKQ